MESYPITFHLPNYNDVIVFLVRALLLVSSFTVLLFVIKGEYEKKKKRHAYDTPSTRSILKQLVVWGLLLTGIVALGYWGRDPAEIMDINLWVMLFCVFFLLSIFLLTCAFPILFVIVRVWKMERVKTYVTLLVMLLAVLFFYPKDARVITGCPSKPVVKNCVCAGMSLNGSRKNYCVGVSHSCNVTSGDSSAYDPCKLNL